MKADIYNQQVQGGLSNLKVITVIDIEVFCKNKKGSLIKYYRTTLTLEEFTKKFFNDEYEDGMLLSEIYKKENVRIQQKSNPFQAVHGFVHKRTAPQLHQKREKFEEEGTLYAMRTLRDYKDSNWDDDSILLSTFVHTPEEIKTILTKELGFVAIRNYGTVNLSNLDEFTREFYKNVL